MERISSVVCTLAERGIPFGCDNEQFGSPNNGNYFGLLETAAKFDPFLLAHINAMEILDQQIPLICQKLYAKRSFNSWPKT